MTLFAKRLDRYLADRRRHGGDLASSGLVLRPFVRFADAEGDEWITTDLFLRWKDRFGAAGPHTWAIRLSVVRGFATWLQGFDPRTEVPPAGLIPNRQRRQRPHIYTDDEIVRIVVEDAQLPSARGLRGATYATLFGLLAVTGLRIGEAVGGPRRNLLVHRGGTRTPAPGQRARRTVLRRGREVMTRYRYPLPIFVQRFFTERLTNQLATSANTMASYRDTFRLLLNFATTRIGRQPTDLLVTDIDADLVGWFLDFLETSRGNSARTRNNRLAGIRSFFKYVAINEPELLHHCRRVLALPPKRYEKRAIDYLDREQIEALLAAPDVSTWCGRRDRALLQLCVQTGLRVSELIDLRCGDVVLGTGAHVRCRGKGRKDRSTPLRADTAAVLGAWLDERADTVHRPLFVSNRNGRLSRDAVERIVGKHVALASELCPTLNGKNVTPHCLRHTAAMALLREGVGCTVIALWLGHEAVETTQVYLHADLQMKEKAMEKTRPINTPPGRYRPSDALLDYLEAL